MELNIRSIILILTTIATGLSAGIFYAWVVTVIPGTKKISDQAYIETMQSINREILNPWFFIVFFGALFLLLVSSFLHYSIKADSIFYLILGATFCYLAGTFLVTMLGNVPLNDVVEKLDITKFTVDDFKSARSAYEDKWNQLNLIRAFAAFVSFVLLIFALFKS